MVLFNSYVTLQSAAFGLCVLNFVVQHGMLLESSLKPLFCR